MTNFLIDFFQYTIDGVLKGMLYALIALSFVVIYRAGRIFNFAQGEVLVLGGYLVLTFCTLFSLPFWLGMILSILSMAVIGVLIERGIFRPLIGQELFSLIMVTIALIFILQGCHAGNLGGNGATFSRHHCPGTLSSGSISGQPIYFIRRDYIAGIDCSPFAPV